MPACGRAFSTRRATNKFRKTSLFARFSKGSAEDAEFPGVRANDGKARTNEESLTDQFVRVVSIIFSSDCYGFDARQGRGSSISTLGPCPGKTVSSCRFGITETFPISNQFQSPLLL